ncbi:uncharacterized protein LOC141910994 isoform X2 [Tubulanus polymorphus]|uniref:uncharacterized protein LOC141910994 isoform X2 n=1 Tax=Tubulanus polymorphus TaxID=672921 RepID=UPI003DA24165
MLSANNHARSDCCACGAMFCLRGIRRSRRRVVALFLGAVAMTCAYFLFAHSKDLSRSNSRPMVIDDVILRDSLKNNDATDDHLKQQSGLACVHPAVELNPPELAKYFYKVPKVTCNQEKDWVYVNNGSFMIARSAVLKHGHVTCDYVPLFRQSDDYTIKDGRRIRAIQNGTKITEDFFKTSCFATDGSKYDNLHIGIAEKPELVRRHETKPLPADSLGMDILMFGFDSVSRMTWMRKLPLTFDYLKNQLGAVVLEGYNIVGDGTPQALLPILTGKTEPELPEARRGHSGAKPVDGHPWIWKDLSDIGYVTLWGEDMPYLGTFNYRMLGFRKAPVDHFMRPFYLSMDKYFKRNKEYCLGSEPRHKLMMKYVTDAFELYKDKPKFTFTFHSECSHDNNNPLSIVDEDMRDWLKNMNERGFLNNTFLVVMSDHGARFSGIREFVQGKHEERNPFFSIRPPPWFSERYPHAVNNLRNNAYRLTTPFDIHATFHDLIHFQNKKLGDVTQRGISLLQEIPRNRTCKLADIEPHWCSCLNWKTVQPRDPQVLRAADALVSVINSMTSSFRGQCEELRVAEIVRSVMYSPNEQVLKFKKSADTDGRVADLSDNTKNDAILYQVTLHTTPGGGHFEATIKYSIKTGKYSVNPREISRTNKYGDAPACVMKQYPHLRPYCYCKKNSTKKWSKLLVGAE